MPSFTLGPHFGLLFLAALALLLVLTLASRVPYLGATLRLAISAGLLAVTAGLLLERGTLDPWLGKWSTWLHLDDQEVSGGTLRIRMDRDGHYWARVRLGGVERRMLVDSGATLTALSAATAEAAGLKPLAAHVPLVIQTANGSVPGRIAKVPELRLGTIVARNLTAVVSPSFGDMDVLGMNFLSRLKAWRVEDGVLVLVPHHPVAGSTA